MEKLHPSTSVQKLIVSHYCYFYQSAGSLQQERKHSAACTALKASFKNREGVTGISGPLLSCIALFLLVN